MISKSIFTAVNISMYTSCLTPAPFVSFVTVPSCTPHDLPNAFAVAQAAPENLHTREHVVTRAHECFFTW